MAAEATTTTDGHQDAAAFQQQDAPPNGVWIDGLDMSKVQLVAIAVRPLEARWRGRAEATEHDLVSPSVAVWRITR